MSLKTISLAGCAPTPLAAYLKALGILRILSTQCSDVNFRACWQGNTFNLLSNLDSEALADFFLRHYNPSPLVAPWNGGSGFYPKDNATAIKLIESSTSLRFTAYRETITAARSAIQHLGLKEKPEKGIKERMLLRCRNAFPETALAWLDSAYVLTDDGAKYPPLLGTGGNDGRLEFTNNFMQRVVELFPLDDESPAPDLTATLLENALFGTPIRNLSDKPIGQFSPAAGGGANASTGFDSKSTINPWDFVLALEGALVFTSAALKRLEGTEPGQLVYPFCVQASGAGYGSATASDEASARCEIWMPLWANPANFSEVQTLFTEGRAWVGRRPAKSGVDFARAIVSLGVDRRVNEFQRFGFHVRNGLAYFATPLQRLKVQRNHVAADLLTDCDAWIQRFSIKGKSSTAPSSIQRAVRRLEAAILSQCAAPQEGNPAIAQELLLAFGDCERSLARSGKWAAENFVSPIPPLSPDWIAAADTGSAEYRLAASLASLTFWVKKQFHPIRRHLESVKVGPGHPSWASWEDESAVDVVSSDTSATDFLIALMRRRMLLAQSSSPDTWPECARISAWPADIADFIEYRLDDDLFIRLLWGLCLVGFPEERRAGLLKSRPESDLVPPAFYAQIKLCFARLPEERNVPVTPTIFHLAASGDGERASAQALRRLHGSSIPITHVPINLSGEAVRRSAAALLFPLWDSQLRFACESIAPALFTAHVNN